MDAVPLSVSPTMVVVPVALRVVNAPVDSVFPPIDVPLIVPPVIVAEDEAKLLAVTRPVPKVTGRLVVVLMLNVPVVASRIGEDAVSVRFPPRVVRPVACIVVNVPVPAVVPPMLVKFAAAGVVTPIGVLLIEPVVTATPLSVPPVMAAELDAKLLAVTRPVLSTVNAGVPAATT